MLSICPGCYSLFTGSNDKLQEAEFSIEEDAFALSDDDLVVLELAQEIKENIVAGRIDDAKDLLYDEFPSLMNSADMTPNSFQIHHIEIDLDIQSLIEATRTSTHLIDSPDSDDLELEIDGPSDEENKTSLLLRAQHLYSLTHYLADPKERARYLLLLGDVCGIFAYSDPERSPLAGYYDQKRRDTLANQVKGAVLRSARSLEADATFADQEFKCSCSTV